MENELFEETLRRLRYSFIDYNLRRFEDNRAIFAIDTNIILDVLKNRNDGERKYKKIFSNRLITIYRIVLEETLSTVKDIYGYIVQEKYEKVIKLLNRENVRILGRPCKNWKEVIEKSNFYGDKELLIDSIEKNLDPNDAQIISQVIFENSGLITRDKEMRLTARMYDIPLTPNKKPIYTNNWGDFLANQRKQK
ncbi:MAG: PIN domain-containing protein [Candidatus Aenigmatarchaeota archaeon]